MKSLAVYTHADVNETIGKLDPALRDPIHKKVQWAEVQLAMKGRTTVVKGVSGTQHTIHWRRTPVKGNDYYLWWAKGGTRGMDSLAEAVDGSSIFIRAIRHHDETSSVLDPCSISDYSLVDIPALDPRYEDQHKAAPNDSSTLGIDVRTVTGCPGSGKTVALLYAARDLAEEGEVLYVTYTEGLAEEAIRFFSVCGLSETVQVRTLEQLEGDILNGRALSRSNLTPEEAFRAFRNRVEQLPDRGPWRGKEEALWAELRAHLVGMALPFAWTRANVQIPPCKVLDRETYRTISKLPDREVEAAYSIGALAIKEERMVELNRARAALERLYLPDASGQIAPFARVTSLVVDEIQDLTPLQIALLAEVVRRIAESRPANDPRRIAFLAAGDESQTVQPSGFEWAKTRDLFHQMLDNVRPTEVPLNYQLRNPERIARVLENTWELYKELPDDLRPRRSRTPQPPDDRRQGDVVRCQVDQGCDWQELLTRLAEVPGRALVDLDGSLSHELENMPDTADLTQVVYTPRQIKGLDRRTVLVWGLAETVARSLDLAKKDSDGASALQARHMIDAVRVAVSRPTETLVILGRDTSTDRAGLSVALYQDARAVDWTELLALLEHEEMTVEERVLGFVLEADEFYGRDDLEGAAAAISRAKALPMRECGQDLGDMVADLDHRIEVKLAIGHVDQLLDSGKHTEAFERYLELRSLAADGFEPAIGNLWGRVAEGANAIARVYWKRYDQCKAECAWAEAVEALRHYAELLAAQGRVSESEALRCLIRRYELAAPPISAGSSHIDEFVELTRQYLDHLGEVARQHSDHLGEVGETSVAKEWLDEALSALGPHPELYAQWQICADKYCDLERIRKDELLQLADAFPQLGESCLEAAKQLRSQEGDTRGAIEILRVGGVEVPQGLKDAVDLLEVLELVDVVSLSDKLEAKELQILADALEEKAKNLRPQRSRKRGQRKGRIAEGSPSRVEVQRQIDRVAEDLIE
ncbi:MAG: AAA family ATPase [Anaerolineales bacterium]|nr:AAA family ATPase [Anaerolineales bacterium]